MSPTLAPLAARPAPLKRSTTMRSPVSLFLPRREDDSIAVFRVQVHERDKGSALIAADRSRLRDGGDFPAGRQQHGVAESFHRASEYQRSICDFVFRIVERI